MPEKSASIAKNLLIPASLLVSLVLTASAVARWRENGWGALVWLAAFVAMFVIRLPFSVKTRGNVIVEAHKDATEVALLVAMFCTMMVLPLLHLATGCFAFADYPLGNGLTAVGALLQIPFLYVFWRSHADLGRNWSPGLEVRQGHGLVTHGIYARIRHPMYAAIWISALAQPLLLHNWIAGFLVLPSFAAMWRIRVPREEAMMRRQVAKEYGTYCETTGRLFPRWGASAPRGQGG